MDLTYDDLKSYTYQELTQYMYGQLGQDVYEYIPLGLFNIDEANRQRNSIKLKAIDNMIKFDESYELSDLTYPTTLYQIYVNACNECDVPIGTSVFPNMDYVVQEKPQDDLTFRDMIGYITELSGTFAACNRTGALELKWYEESENELTPQNRFNFIPSDDLVQIKGVIATIDDTKYLAGTEQYSIDLSLNPLLQSDFETLLQNIYNNVKDTSFTPFESNWQGNPAMQTGDKITQTDRDGNVYNTLVTSSTYKYRGASTLKAEGLPISAKGYKGYLNKKIKSIIKQSESTEKNTEVKFAILEESITQNATQISTTEDRVTTAESSITQNADQIQLRVTQTTFNALGNRVTTAESSITQNADQIQLRVTQTTFNALGNRVTTAESSITQNADQIALKVSETDYNGNTISSLINQTATTIKIQASKIDLQGYVTATDLSGSGTTVINGANISTGYLSADRISGGIISGVSIDVETDVNIGQKLYLLPSSSTGTRGVYFNGLGGDTRIYCYSSDLFIESQGEMTIEARDDIQIETQYGDIIFQCNNATMTFDSLGNLDLDGGFILNAKINEVRNWYNSNYPIQFQSSSGRLYFRYGSSSWYKLQNA